MTSLIDRDLLYMLVIKYESLWAGLFVNTRCIYPNIIFAGRGSTQAGSGLSSLGYFGAKHNILHHLWPTEAKIIVTFQNAMKYPLCYGAPLLFLFFSVNLQIGRQTIVKTVFES